MIPKLFYVSIILLSINLILFLIKSVRTKFYKIRQDIIDKLIADNKLKEAKEKISNIAQRIPRDAHLHYSIGYLFWKENKIDEAVAQLKLSLNLDKKMALANFLLGYITFYNLGRKTDAIYYLERAIKLNKKLTRAYNTLGVIYMNMNEYIKANNMFKKVLEYTGQDEYKKNISNVYNNLGIIEIKKGNYESAINNLKKAVEIDPASIDININLGNVYGMRMDYSLAFESFEKAEFIQNDNKFVKYWIGCLHYLKGEYTKAIEKLKEAINIDNEFAHAYLQIAIAWKKLGNEEESKSAYEKAYSLNPNIRTQNE